MVEFTPLPEKLPVDVTAAELEIDPPIWSVDDYLAVIPKSKRQKAAVEVGRRRRWIGFGRYSSLKQEEDSLGRQWKNTSPLWTRPGQELVAWITEPGKSGTTSHGRPGLARLMAMIRAGEVDAVGVEDLDRLYRNVGLMMMMYEEMVECGVELWDSKHGQLNWIQVYTLGLMAQLGRERLLQNMAGGRVEKILKGRIFTKPIFGYRYHPTKRKGRIVDEELRALIITVFEQIAGGATCYQVAQDLCAKYPDGRPGAPPPRDGKPPFTEKFVRRLIRNELYMGLSVFNRNKVKHDFATRRVSGKVENPLSKRYFVEVKQLRVVSVKLWSQANARLADRNPGAGNAGGKLAGPFSGRTFCGCGASMKRHGPSDRQVLRCERQLQNASSCRLHGGLPLAWFEAKLLDKLGHELQSVASGNGIRAEVSALVQTAKTAVQSNRRAKTVRLAAVNKDLDRLFDENEIDGYTPDWLAASRRALCEEQEELKKALAKRDDFSAYDTIVDELKGLGDAIKTISKSLPFAVASAEDQVLLDLIHQKVADVRVYKSKNEGSVRFVMRIDLGEKPASLEMDTGQLLLQFTDQTNFHVVEFDAKLDFLETNDRRTTQARTRADEREALAATGVHDVPAKVWKAIQPLLADVDFGTGEMAVEPRRVFDGVFFALRTGANLAALPSRYGAENAVFRILHRMARCGTLDPVINLLETQFSTIAATLDLSKLRNTRLPRSTAAQSSAGPGKIKLAPQHAAELEREAERLGIDPAEKARMLAVAAVADGMTQKAAAQKFSFSPVYISLLVNNYRSQGVGALRAKAWNQPKSAITIEVCDALKKFVEQGFDPKRPNRPLTLTRIKEFLLEKQIDVSVEHIGRFLNKHNISLREAIATARTAA